MTCQSCSLDKTITVLHAVTIYIVDRYGNLQPRVLSKRQCLECGGADAPTTEERKATLAEVKATRTKAKP